MPRTPITSSIHNSTTRIALGGLLAIATLFTCSLAVGQNPNWTRDGTLSAYVQNAQATIMGTVVDIKVVELNERGEGYTTYTLCNVSVITGTIERQEFIERKCLEIDFPGARLTDTITPVLTRNVKYILFLRGYFTQANGESGYSIPIFPAFVVTENECITDVQQQPVISIDRDLTIRKRRKDASLPISTCVTATLFIQKIAEILSTHPPTESQRRPIDKTWKLLLPIELKKP